MKKKSKSLAQDGTAQERSAMLESQVQEHQSMARLK